MSLLSMALIVAAKAPDHVADYRDFVVTAMREAAATGGGPSANQSRIIEQITAALHCS